MSASFLQPVSADSPCGADNAGDVFQIETLVKGKPETQFSAAQDPDWRNLIKVCEAALAQSRHISVIVIYATALLRTRGIEGLADGMETLSGNIQSFWADIHPRLNPDDDNDPSERLSILADLAAPVGREGDSIRFIERLNKLALIQVPVLGTLSLETVEAEGDVCIERFHSALADKPEVIAAQCAEAGRALKAVESMIQFIESAVDSRYGTSWMPLLQALRKQVKILSPLNTSSSEESGDASATGESSSANASAGAAKSAKGGSGSSTIETREDVIRILDRICDYYARCEPSSPVPLLLKTARGLVHNNFLEIVAKLSPEVTMQLKDLAQKPE